MNKKIKLALIVDVENWAYANIAKNFKKQLENNFEISIIPMSKINENSATMWLILKDYEIVHFFCRGLSISYEEEYFKNQLLELGGDLNSFTKEYIKGKVITTCVYDHLFLEKDIEFTKKLFSKVKNYYVSSNILKKIYDNLEIKYKPQTVITDGVNLEQFYPINIDRFNNLKDRTIKIGWVGNSKWVDNTDDYKGVHTILKPAIEQLRQENYNVELYTSDKTEKHIPLEQMVNYYSNIDIYACLSKAEGTPNPILESMACGIPVISTDVGIVRDALGKKQSEMILEQRSIECLKNKIKFLINNPKKFKEYSQENLENIKEWTWENKSKEFEKFILRAYYEK